MSWSVGGWFGPQLGSTLWMFICAGLLTRENAAVALVVLLLGLLANGVGLMLWARRERLSIYSAMQFLIAVLAVVSFATVAIVDQSGLWETLHAGTTLSAPATYLLMGVLFPGLLWKIRADQRKSAIAG